jgi:sulfate/thiosulfate transport system substrate-binding protein
MNIRSFEMGKLCKKLLFTFVWGGVLSGSAWAGDLSLLNVSYDPTREFYEAYNPLFQKHWKEKTQQPVTIQQSHGGSGKQARSVIDGLKADVVTLALGYDIDAIAEKAKLLPENWETLLPHKSVPYTSTIVFLVRKGNPKHITDWDSLIGDGVQVITPHPKTSGGARWNYLAAYGYALKKFQNNEDKAKQFIKTLFQHVPVLDSGARAATTTFVKRGLGDVLLSWENEALLAQKELGKDQFDIVYPSVSIAAEPSVAVVEKVAQEKGTLEVARDYLKYLYSEEAQTLAAKSFFRPLDPKVQESFKDQFPKLHLVTIDDFGGWKKAQHVHFDDGGIFDQITAP